MKKHCSASKPTVLPSNFARFINRKGWNTRSFTARLYGRFVNGKTRPS